MNTNPILTNITTNTIPINVVKTENISIINDEQPTAAPTLITHIVHHKPNIEPKKPLKSKLRYLLERIQNTINDKLKILF